MPPPVGEAHRIRVASYNVRALKDDRAALVELIRSMAPDVLLLQEVPRHPISGHRIANFADAVGLTWFGGKRFRMSTTLLTSLRLDVLDAQHGRLPVRAFDEPRGFGMATVQLPDHQPLVACSVHLSLRNADRLREAKALLAEATSRRLPLVVGGDLNEEPSGPTWRYLGRELHEVSAGDPTYSTQQPHKRIDAVFASSQLPGATPKLSLPTDLLVAATDHLPVVVDLDASALAKEPAPAGIAARG
jgi:endonuclease/exonuclease/phosphatase family metal-dependent hydrolase